MKKSILFLIIFMSSYSITCTAGSIGDIENLKSNIQTTLSGIERYQISYYGEMIVQPTSDTNPSLKNVSKEIDFYVGYLSKINSGEELNPKEKVFQRDWTVDDAKKFLKGSLLSQNGGSKEIFYTHSRDGQKKRQDILSPEYDDPYYLLFDGYNGYFIKPEKNEIRSGASFTSMWYTPFSCVGCGFNLDQFLGDEFSLGNYDSASRTIDITSPVMMGEGVRYRFELLDDSDAYWKSCAKINKDGIVEWKVICDRFETIDGFKIPKSLRYQRFNGEALIDFVNMNLTDAKLNADTDLPSDYFDLPENPSKIHRMRRE